MQATVRPPAAGAIGLVRATRRATWAAPPGGLSRYGSRATPARWDAVLQAVEFRNSGREKWSKKLQG